VKLRQVGKTDSKDRDPRDCEIYGTRKAHQARAPRPSADESRHGLRALAEMMALLEQVY